MLLNFIQGGTISFETVNHGIEEDIMIRSEIKSAKVIEGLTQESFLAFISGEDIILQEADNSCQ